MSIAERWTPALSIAAVVLALAPGCRKENPAPPMAEVPAAPAAAAPEPAGGGGMGSGPGGAMQGDVPAPPHPSGANALKWTLPGGWSEEGGSGMRFATLKPPAPGRVDVSVVVLPGTAGGELANVNRWRSQIGLGPLDDAGLAAARKVLETKAGKVALFDFEAGEKVKTRMVAGLLETADGSTWFLKMVGDDAPVTASRAAFVRFVETLHF